MLEISKILNFSSEISEKGFQLDSDFSPNFHYRKLQKDKFEGVRELANPPDTWELFAKFFLTVSLVPCTLPIGAPLVPTFLNTYIKFLVKNL